MGMTLARLFKQTQRFQIEQVGARCLIDDVVQALMCIGAIAFAGIEQGVRKQCDWRWLKRARKPWLRAVRPLPSTNG